MVQLQLVKGSVKRSRACRCTVACCVDNAGGSCTSRPYSSKVCNVPCAKFVQAEATCTSRCSACGCSAG